MYVKGITDYNKKGEPRQTGLFAGPLTQDGELRTTQGGKTYGTASVRAFNRKDGTAAFLTVKSFDDSTAHRLAALHKGDPILVAGVVESREYNGKTYTDLLVDLLLTPVGMDQAANRDALEGRMAAAGFGGGSDFTPIDGEDGDLPF